MTSTLSLRTFDESCIEPFLALAKTYYPDGHDARNPDYLRWAFLRNPAGAGRVACAVAPGGKWSGMMGLVPFRIRRGESTFTASMVVNVLVHPDHRKEKLFVGMIRHTCQELASTGEWLIGHPNAAAVRGWKSTNMGFRDGYEIRSVPPVVTALSGKGERLSGTGDPALQASFAPLAEWQTRLNEPVIAADAAFLRWRFLLHPSRSYRVFVYRTAAGVTGYRVDREFRTGAVRWLVDWQGEDTWKKGPARGVRPALVPWPKSLPPPARSWDVPRVNKHYEFFATPCASMENDGDPWRYLTLAATDFA